MNFINTHKRISFLGSLKYNKSLINLYNNLTILSLNSILILIIIIILVYLDLF